MGAIAQASREWSWACLDCRGPLAPDASTLRCAGCGKYYPVIERIPILLREPIAYLHSEIASLAQIYRDGHERRESLDRIGRDLGLPDTSLERHKDRIDAEIGRAETLLALLEPVSAWLGKDMGESAGMRPSGWTLDALVPYLMRDWTNTSELQAIAARIGAALHQFFPDPSGRSIVFPACGAAGLLADVAAEFERALGFDLTLPVLAAARHLLDGKSLDLALPRSINQAGRITLRRRDGTLANSHVELAAMDAFDTAFADASVDCVVTSFLIDLVPEPQKLADEIHRVLSSDGIWINYGPSGPLKALWRFDRTEGAAFLEAAGFTVMAAEAYRSTYLDLSRDCPAWSFQNHICYLTAARKSGPGRQRPIARVPPPSELPEITPLHFPGAILIERQSLGAERTRITILRHEALPGRAKSFEISTDTAQIITLVDGQRTVADIAKLLNEGATARPFDDTFRSFANYFEQGLLSWRGH